MTTNDKYDFYIKELENIRHNDSFRFLKTIQNREGKYVLYNNEKYINLSSNDYLGLATDRQILSKFYNMYNVDNAIDMFGLGGTSSRLLTGDYFLYSELENCIARLYNKLIVTDADNSEYVKRKALVFSSGYHANMGILSALTDKDDLILSDQLNHASIIDGTRLSRSCCFPFEHLNYEDLENLLEANRKKYNKVIIVSESVFSMDGDIADIKKLIEIKNKYNALLYIDEAHALGIFGENGLGICERDNAAGDVDIIVATFGKALGSLGAYAVTNSILHEYLINKTRALIFTTALPPVIVSWNLFNMNNLSALKEKKVKLLNLAEKLRQSFIEQKIKTSGSSQIVPVIIGENNKTLKLAQKLQENGFLLFPIRPPTVPAGTSRIRISLSANVDWEDIRNIPEIISSKKQ